LYKILVVDSENLVAEICRAALFERGHEVFVADNGAHALALTEQNSFDLAIVNIGQEDLTGVETFKWLRQSSPTLVGILIAGDNSLEVVNEALNSGFSRVCKKPLNENQLLEAVTETLKIASLRDEITRMKTLLPLYELGQKFICAESEQAVFTELVEAVSKELGVPSISLMMFDEASCSLKVVAYRGLDPRYVENLEIKPGEQISGKVFTTQSPVILNRDSQHLSPYIDQLRRKELSAAISFPISNMGKVLGVINISETRDGSRFSEADIEMLSVITSQAMMALDNVRSMKEREDSSRVRALLEQYVSPEVSKLLIGANQDMMDVGSVQRLTVLFADIRNFTLLVQHLEPTQLRIFLNKFFDLFANIVFSWQGMLDKFMGDAALVIFGAPVKVENPNLAAVSVACQIISDFEKLRILWAKKDKVFDQVGLAIGISRGPMFLGNVGSSRRLDYTVIGTDVNIAQRLASKAESGQVLITDRVEKNLAGQFPVMAEEKMLLRGMESEVSVYSLRVTG
jgi:adenylate cyclase